MLQPGLHVHHHHVVLPKDQVGQDGLEHHVLDERDEEFLRRRIPEEDLLGFIHYNADVIEADRNGQSPFDYSDKAVEEIRAIKNKMDSEK